MKTEQVESSAASSPARAYASPWFGPRKDHLAAGDLVLLITGDHKRYIVKLVPGQELHTHQGVFPHDDLIGHSLGMTVTSQLDQKALVLEPALRDLMKHLKRGTQIVYPKDAAYVVHRLNLRAGCRVVEAGTGSGVLTTALAWAVAPTGRVYTYEARPETYQLAERNLERVAMLPYVEMNLATIDDGIRQTSVDAFFLDVRMPWKHLDAARQALVVGGYFGAIVPTTNQVCELLIGLEEYGFVEVTVEELILRGYKPVPERLRPEDSMVAHTGYLVFARSLRDPSISARWQSRERQRYNARMRLREQLDATAEGSDEADRKYPKLPLPG